jgi:hypothetical protein
VAEPSQAPTWPCMQPSSPASFWKAPLPDTRPRLRSAGTAGRRGRVASRWSALSCPYESWWAERPSLRWAETVRLAISDSPASPMFPEQWRQKMRASRRTGHTREPLPLRCQRRCGMQQSRQTREPRETAKPWRKQWRALRIAFLRPQIGCVLSACIALRIRVRCACRSPLMCALKDRETRMKAYWRSLDVETRLRMAEDHERASQGAADWIAVRVVSAQPARRAEEVMQSFSSA